MTDENAITAPIEDLPPQAEAEAVEPEAPAEDPLLRELSSLRAELSSLREELEKRQKADEINRRNASLSAGRVGSGTAPEYYTPKKVHAMSPSEIRENYQRIRASMKKWH